MNLFDDLDNSDCRRSAPLAPLTWFRLGGPAEYLLAPKSEDQLSMMIRRCRESGVPVRFLGMGANVIVPDEGVSGAVVRLDAEAFTTTTIDGSCVTAGAGVDLTKLVRRVVREGLAGLENIAGIPGTVGGGICMNCGGRYGEIGTAVKKIHVIGSDGRAYERDHDDLEFGYRRCTLGSDCIVSAEFQLERMDRGELETRFREIYLYKQNTQPPLGAQSVGCIFRNPAGRSAGEIIDRAGLKGLRLGSAYVSERHANFVLADPGGRAADVIQLIRLVGQRVEDHCGIRLEPEVKIW
jgi:UDP-N-acetylmuramate dehydrogenase